MNKEVESMSSIRRFLTEESLSLFGDYVISSNGLKRLEYYQEFEDLYQNSPIFNFEYGRIYNLSEMTEFLVILTQAARNKDQSPYLTDEDHRSNGEMNKVGKVKPFSKWESNDWVNFRLCLTKIQGSMLRTDANASVHDANASVHGTTIYDGLVDKRGIRNIDGLRSEDPWFTDKLLNVLKLFSFHEKFAPFREVLERKSTNDDDDDDEDVDTFDNEEDLKALTVTKEFMDAYMQVIEDEEEIKIKNAFLAFLRKDKRRTFHSPSTIRKLLNDPKKPMSYAFILNRVNKLFRSWAEKVLPKSILAEKYSNDAKVEATEDAADAAAVATTSEANNKSESDHVRALGRLQRARARLDDRVEDPLPEVLAAANRAKRKQTTQNYQSEDDEEDKQLLSPSKSKRMRSRSPRARGKLLEKKKTAIRLGFTPEEADVSDSENIEDPEEEEEVLSQVKKRTIAVKSPGSPTKTPVKSQQKKYEGRRAWTDVEKNAIKEGIQNFGIGKWALIKEENAVILGNRTSGQIKDCFRTMKKRGELDDLKEAWPEKEKSTNEEEEEEKQEEPAEEEEKQEEPAEGEEKQQEDGEPVEVMSTTTFTTAVEEEKQEEEEPAE